MSYIVQGIIDENLTGHNDHYWGERNTKIDCRSRFLKISPESFWGFSNTIITMSHDISAGNFGPMTEKRLWVDANAWITSNCILYNCWIKSNAIVSCGSVVSSVIVEKFCMVQGNPAKVVAKFINGKWTRLEVAEELKKWK
jgi:acetyltransferase-like isoleucine patch superfamily enzyme